MSDDLRDKIFDHESRISTVETRQDSIKEDVDGINHGIRRVIMFILFAIIGAVLAVLGLGG